MFQPPWHQETWRRAQGINRISRLPRSQMFCPDVSIGAKSDPWWGVPRSGSSRHVSLGFSIGLGSGEFGVQVSSFVDLLFYIWSTEEGDPWDWNTGWHSTCSNSVTQCQFWMWLLDLCLFKPNEEYPYEAVPEPQLYQNPLLSKFSGHTLT